MTNDPAFFNSVFPPQFAFIYFFNLHLGQGIIILPKLVSRTGLLLSILLLACIVGVNLITGTHILEAMGIANACYRLEARKRKSETEEMGVSNCMIASCRHAICMTMIEST